MLYKILLAGILIVSALPLSAAEQFPVLDSGFGVKSFSVEVPGQEADVLVSVAQSPDGAFYVAGENTLTRLDSAGKRVWSRYYLADDNPYALAQGNIAVDSDNNVYISLVIMDDGYAHVFKFGTDGTLLKDYTWPVQNAEVYGTVLNRSTGRLYAVFMDDLLNIAMLDTELNLLNSVSHDASSIVPVPGVGMDKDGNVYVGGLKYPGHKEFVAVKYSPGLEQIFEFFEPAGPAGSEFGLLDAYGTSVYTGGFYLSGWEYEVGSGDGHGNTGIVSISSSGVMNWESMFDTQFMRYSPSGTDNAGNFYGTGYATDWTPQFTKMDYLTGGVSWSIPETHSSWIGGVIFDGQNRLYTVGYLMEGSGTEYYYIARYAQGGDATSPAAISDLTVSSVSSDSITLAWTAVGDDWTDGTAAVYDLRYTSAGAIIVEDVFAGAMTALGEPAPQSSGNTERYTITGLEPDTTYYLAVKAVDEAGNTGGLSNPASGATKALPKYRIEKSTGDWQIVTVNTWSTPLESLVKILGATKPASGIGVDFTISTYPAGAEGYELTKTSEAANTLGLADVQFKLGNIPAEYGVTATCNSCEHAASSVTFTCCGKLSNDDFKQYDVKWATHPYNTQTPTYTKTLRRVGCAVSALSTLINYYAESFPELRISTTTPKKLNDILENKTNPKGFDSNHDIDFKIVKSTSVSNGKIKYIQQKDYVYPLTDISIQGTRALIDKDIDKGLPVIVAVRRSNETETEKWKHFILIVGKCGNKYIISDPASIVEGLLDPTAKIKLKDNSFVGPVVSVRRFLKLSN